MSLLRSWVVVAVLTSSGLAGAAGKPIVAVFNVETKGVQLAEGVQDRLSDYIASSLTEKGVYQIVPRDQLRQRLTQQKKTSYKQCYDQSCQIEIGKELAAQKSLATQVMKLGSRCVVTMTLFDLRRSTTEQAATAEGACTEDGILDSIKSAAGKLGLNRAAASPSPAPAAAPRRAPGPARGGVTVDFSSSPAGADVILDGQARGRTPLRLSLAKGRTYAVLFRKEGYAPVERSETVTGYKAVEVALELSQRGQAMATELNKTRTEWLTLEPGIGVSNHGFMGGGGAFRFFTLKWAHFYWTILESAGGGGPGTWFMYLGSAVGFPLYFGDRLQHQLKLGVGLGFGMGHDNNGAEQMDKVYNSLSSFSGGRSRSGTAMVVAPAVLYTYHLSGRWYLGAGLRALVAAVSGFYEDVISGTASGGTIDESYTDRVVILMTFQAGFTSAPAGL